ncbi:MAG: hypothetical protein HC945_00990, partial [Nitrosarchaeum sp.]|nr:hypothetical protein [Nitrosarchaeum sp.]
MEHITFAEKAFRKMVDPWGRAFIPKKFQPYIKEYFFKAGIYEIPYRLHGVLFYIAAALTAFTYLGFIMGSLPWQGTSGAIISMVLTLVIWSVLHLLYFTMVDSAVYFYINLRIYNRTKELEARLPDYLTLVSTNLKGGLSFEKSLWAAIKPEFGVLANEIALVSKKVLTGSDVSEAMMEFGDKYDSPVLRRSINLMVGEMDSGGRIVDVIDKIIETLKKTKHLKDEMAANT